VLASVAAPAPTLPNGDTNITSPITISPIADISSNQPGRLCSRRPNCSGSCNNHSIIGRVCNLGDWPADVFWRGCGLLVGALLFMGAGLAAAFATPRLTNLGAAFGLVLLSLVAFTLLLADVADFAEAGDRFGSGLLVLPVTLFAADVELGTRTGRRSRSAIRLPYVHLFYYIG
jgi:hypothetical protein